MFSRYLFALCAILFVTFVVADLDFEVEETEIEDDSVESRNPALAIAIRVLAQAFKWAAKHCLKEAAHNCKQHWKHPKALVNCGRGYLQANKGRCVVG